MDTLTLKVPRTIKAKLNAYSKRKGLSMSEIIRHALIEYFEKDEFGNKGTFYDYARDLAGSVDGPPDLSTNKDHFEGYGQ